MTTETTLPYAKPRSLSDAVALIGGDDVCLLAGGTDLVIMRAEGMIAAERIVDLKGIAGLDSVEMAEDSIAIGACTRLDPLAQRAPFPANAIRDGAALVGSWQTRARATIGGNICRASPAADTLCGLLALDCQLELASASGTRRVPAAEFFTGPGRTVMRRDELLARIIMPRRPGGSAYQRFTYRNAMDLSVAGVAVHLAMRDGRCTEARVAIGACGPKPILVPDAAAALVGSPVDATAVQAAAQAVIAAATPIDDVRGTRKHRLHVLRPLTYRVTELARARAMEQQP
ncbi:FAD binding domain-containing protein [Shinella zoogloeoides]|uniref:FAD binding domain-containing protein n=1 Tax=Shinella zoogloeoides TaxID=352475 RepID=UPI00299CED92|nr:FAD binding domain-containing protein [Shinella zoogloeoides]WPE24212.1 6-hydroxypseudooxynicotine dehydrogenase complex subunit alpha [Shinella zoogloeoides]